MFSFLLGEVQECNCWIMDNCMFKELPDCSNVAAPSYTPTSDE